eukprot:6178436-Prymnesium_polylepis.1
MVDGSTKAHSALARKPEHFGDEVRPERGVVPYAPPEHDLADRQRPLDAAKGVLAQLARLGIPEAPVPSLADVKRDLVADRAAAVRRPDVARRAVAGFDDQVVEAALACHVDSAQSQRLADAPPAGVREGPAHGAAQRLALDQGAEAHVPPAHDRRPPDRLDQLDEDGEARV